MNLFTKRMSRTRLISVPHQWALLDMKNIEMCIATLIIIIYYFHNSNLKFHSVQLTPIIINYHSTSLFRYLGNLWKKTKLNFVSLIIQVTLTKYTNILQECDETRFLKKSKVQFEQASFHASSSLLTLT